MNVDCFDFDLPETLIAQTPLSERTQSRLLTLNKRTGETGHVSFSHLIDFLQAGDTLVLNDTRVIPARLFGVKESTGAKVEVLLLSHLGDDRWEVLVKPGKRVKEGTVIIFGDQMEGSPLKAVVEQENGMGGRIVRFFYRGIFNEILDRLGHMPLPPYIKQQLADKERYQTVYARSEGSAAAPTAGLHFTETYLKEIEEKGVKLAYITLHVGLGTFRPVSAERVEEHKMHAEYYHVSHETAMTLNATRAAGGRIIAVGTTTARTLETLAQNADETKQFQSGGGWTSIFIYPGYEFRAVDAMLTNFHLPKSTLVMLISALAGRENVLKAYKEAVDLGYRFFSFGDAMFIY